nr:hypothetical protein [Tanacetum cinerariifolium]
MRVLLPHLVLAFPGLRKKYRLSLKNNMPTRDKMDNPDITMEEYIRLEEEKAGRHGKVYNWELLSMVRSDLENNNEKVNMPSFPSPEPKVSCFDDFDFFKDSENAFPAIVYNDALTSKSDFLIELPLSPRHIDEFDLKDETSLSEYDEVKQNILYFNDLFPFNIIYPDDLNKNLYVSFSIPFDPKRFYKDGVYIRMLQRPIKMLIKHKDAQGHSVFTSQAWRRLFEIRGPTKLGRNDTNEMVNVLSSMEAANILTSEVAAVSVSPIAGVSTKGVPTVSGLLVQFLPLPVWMSEQLARDSEIARLHAEEEQKMMIEGLDRSNEVIAKHLQEYEQAAVDLSVGENIELINELVNYQDHHTKILKYQAQQSKPLSKKEQREFYMSVLRSHAGWKTRHFRGITLEEIKEKFIPEDLKGMMQLVPLEEVYVEALQATKDKEKELWVELKRLFEPDFKDQLWTHNQALMHDPLEWKLYDTCGVHHVFTKDQEIFMLVEKDYPLRKGLATVMISNKLQKFKIQQYLYNEHYALWEVIEFGDSYKAPLEEISKGPASESSAKKKGRTAIVSHLEFMDVEIKQDDLNQKFLTSLAPEWLIGKGEVHTASVLTASIQVSTASTDVAAASLCHDTVCAYIASQSNGSQIKYEDITQIDKDDIEEIDIKWNMALLSMRADRFWKKTGKKNNIQGSDVAENHALVTDDEVPTEFALMAKSRSSSKNEFPPPAQVYSPPKKDLSWTSLPEFVDDTVTDYSSIMSKPMIKFVKAADCPIVTKTNNTKNARKSTVKYAEIENPLNNIDVADLLTKPFDVRRFQYLVVEQVMRSSVRGNHILCTTVVSQSVLGWGIGTSRIRVFIEYSCEQRTHEFIHVYLVFASVCMDSNFIMAKLAFCDYHNMIAILEKTEHNTDFHEIVEFLEACHLRYSLTICPTVYVSHIRQFWSTVKIETTNQETKILATIDGKPRTISESSIMRHLKLSDEEGISSLHDTELFKNLSLMGYNILPNQRFTFQKGQFSHQWKFLIHTIMQCLSSKSTGFNEFSSNIATAVVCLATNRVYNFSKMIFDGMVRNITKDAPLKGGITEIGEEVRAYKSTELGSNDTDEMVNVLSSMKAANILISRVAAVSVSPIAGVSTKGVPNVSGLFPTASAIFTTASVVTPYTRRSRWISIKDKGEEKMVKYEVPKKRKLQEHIDAQVAKEMEEEFARENQRMSEQLARDSKIARLHAKEELKMMIEGEKIELINKLVKYQDYHTKILKYQAQQSKPLSMTEQREFYMSVLRSHAGWKTRHLRGMTLKEIKEKFIPVGNNLKILCLCFQKKKLVPLEEVYVEALQVKHPIIDWVIHSEEKMMLDSIDNGLLVYPTVKENGQTRPKEYSELTKAQQLQDNFDVQAINIILYCLSPEVKQKNATTSKGNVAAGPSRVMKCYNCQGEGHMARQCTQSDIG